MEKLSRKGQVQTLAPAIIALLLAATLLIFGLVILQELRDTEAIAGAGDINVNSTSYTTANATVVGMATFADFWEIIVLAIVISIVIGLLLVVFGGGARQK